MRQQFLGKNIEMGKNVQFDKSVQIGQNVVIEDNVYLGHGVVIGNDTHIKSGARIENNATVGYENLTKKKKYYEDYPTSIGMNVIIRTNTVIYRACIIGDNTWVNHNTILRENTIVGKNSTIGNMVMCEGYTKIGNQVAIHSLSGLGGNTIIEDKVFIATSLVTANNRRANWLRINIPAVDSGQTIRMGARIAINVTLLPDIEIGKEALIGGGAVVTKDVPAFAIVVGVPARIVGEVPREERLDFSS